MFALCRHGRPALQPALSTNDQPMISDAGHSVDDGFANHKGANVNARLAHRPIMVTATLMMLAVVVMAITDPHNALGWVASSIVKLPQMP